LGCRLVFVFAGRAPYNQIVTAFQHNDERAATKRTLTSNFFASHGIIYRSRSFNETTPVLAARSFDNAARLGSAALGFTFEV
jgi:hypothetical protein